MKVHILFGQRKESYEGEHAPEVLAAWDEYSVEENPEGFDQDVALCLKEVGDSMAATRVIKIDVDQARIRALLVGTPIVKGVIDDPGTV